MFKPLPLIISCIIFLFFNSNLFAMEKNLFIIFTKTVSCLLLEILRVVLNEILILSGTGNSLVKKKKLKINYPSEHVLDKKEVLKNLQKFKSDSYIMWIDPYEFIIKLGETTIITDPVF